MADISLAVTAQGVVIKVRVQPQASRNKILGKYGEALKVALSAAPVDSAANQACIELIAKSFGMKKAQVKIKSGHKSKDKQILLVGMQLTQIQTSLKEILVDG